MKEYKEIKAEVFLGRKRIGIIKKGHIRGPIWKNFMR